MSSFRAAPTCIVLMLCCIAVPARADAPKPKIAVLGLEAAPSKDTGSVDPQTTELARAVTDELRNRARGGAGGFVIAPNSDKELGDEKLLNNCDNERADCMAMIGVGLAANFVLYGRVEKKGESYRVSLKLLDVSARTVEPATGELSDGKSASTLAKKLYAKLVGGSAELVVTANADSGKVFIDEELKGKLSKGTAKIQGIPDGRHTLAIEAPGFERYESKIVTEHGEQTTFTATLIEKDTGGTPGKPWTGWRTMFWVSLGLAGATGITQGIFAMDAAFIAGPDINTPTGAAFKDGRTVAKVNDSDCSGFSARSDTEIFAPTAQMPDGAALDIPSRDALKRACRDNALAKWGFLPTGILIIAAGVAFYEWRINGASEQPAQTAKHARKGVDYTLAPLVTEHANGMSLLVIW